MSDGQRTITYDYDNMPTKVGTMNFTYDGYGNRIKKYVTSPSIIYIDKYYECTSGACTKYIFAGDKRIASKSSGAVLYYHGDHLGSTSVVTDSLGAKWEGDSYLPFGKAVQGSGTNSRYLYTGQENDSETGLYNYKARLYDPDLGRFLTPDTIVPDPENPQALNRYSYVLNNPLSYTDPTGHSFWSAFWKSLIEAFTHPNGEASFNVTYTPGGNTNTTVGPGNSGPSTSSSSSSNSSGSGPSISISAGPTGTNGNANGGMNINIYNNGSWVGADSLNMQLLNSFQRSEGSGSGYSSGGQLSLYLDNSVLPQNSWASGSPRFNFDQFANEVRDNRFDLSATLGTLATTMGVGTMPKTSLELRGFGVPKSELNPFTNQLSRLTTRTGNRSFRDLGRTTAGKAIGRLSTGLTVVEGLYDWWVIGRAAVNATTW